MPYAIDTSSYNKAMTYPTGHGYDLRFQTPMAVIVHSTEGAIGQTLQSAASYIYNSSGISAHYLIGRSAEIIQFLDPLAYSAWHSGDAVWPYENPTSIGIECLHAKGENWPTAQIDALAWVLQQLCSQYHITTTYVDTHGQVAIAGPYIRKVDPTNWPRSDFLAWRDRVLAPQAVPYQVAGLPVYQQSTRTGPLWGHLAPGQRVKIDDPANGHVCEIDGVPAGIGFVDLAGLKPL